MDQEQNDREAKEHLQEQIRQKRRRKTLLPILGMIAILAGIWVVFGSNASKESTNASSETQQSFNAIDLMALDDAKLVELQDQMISVEGNISDVASEEDGITVVLTTDEESMNSITCQIDNDNLTEAKKLSADNSVKLSGMLSGHSNDDIIGGKSIELKNCTIINE